MQSDIHAYLFKQGWYLLGYQMKAQKIETLLRSKNLSPNDRGFFLRVQEIKSFAIDSIGLKKTKNYSTYISIDKDHLITVLSAAKSDTLASYHWHFPLFGAFPYLGFYEREDAMNEAEKMKKKGFDTFAADVDAFSTLGIFTDPLYSYMKRYSEYSLASLLIHEMTHETLFLKNNVQFNEELASFVAEEGARVYIKNKYGDTSLVYRMIAPRVKDEKRFTAVLSALGTDLRQVYEKNIPSTEKITQKKKIIELHKQRFIDGFDSLFITKGYKTYAEVEWNNAFIMYFMTYQEDLEPFYKLLANNNNSLKSTIAHLTKLKNKPGDPRRFIRDSLLKNP
ncbi:MAG: aminopeptidase [Chitinivibrionales bacterium]|nr:aminopeptidase [Chitinivibrionales bacterium]